MPKPSTFSDPVNVPNPSALTNLTVTVDLTDQASVQNLSLVLVAPNGDQITLVQNQNDALGKSHTGQGLPGGNAIGQFGYAPGTSGTPGIAVGTIFDDNATRNIFDPTTAGVNGNSATDYIGYFRPEGSQFTDTLPALGRADSLTNFLALEMSKGEINGPWTLQVTNYTSTAPAAGNLEHFSLQFSTGMSASSPRMIDQTLVTGAIGNTFPLKPPSAPSTGVGPGLVLAIDNTLTSGLGEPGSDNVTASFRIFTLSQADALSSQAWTAVGPASIGGSSSTPGGDPSGRVTGLAIDPSDPSGNTVYAAGASGGIWKTTDFLTTSAAGPTWIPLTDFGPTSGVNIGGIAVFPRNNDPNQSIIIAATGEGDTGTPGVGFLISDDGGATWNLYDSTDNVDSSGNVLPISSASRDREFVGNTSYKVIVDPKPTPSGQVIIYAAMSGPNGGIWRSEDTGKTWKLMLSGQATDVVLDPESGIVLNPDTNTYVQGNLQVVYAAIRGVGVFMSPNQGQVWNQMLGGIGNPLIFDTHYAPSPNVNPVNGPTPNGAEGRIALAVPNPTGNAAQDAVYEGWLYAIVSTPAGALDGIFVTKDFGQNWTQVRIPTEPNQGYQTNPAIPANDVGLADYPDHRVRSVPAGQLQPSHGRRSHRSQRHLRGRYQRWQRDRTDPHQPDRHLGCPLPGRLLGFRQRRRSAEPELYRAGRGRRQNDSHSTVNGRSSRQSDSYLNYIRNPGNPFEANATLDVFNYSQFTNNGAGVEWIPFDVGGTDYHRIVTMIDPTTGLPRLIFGNDQGIWSVLDNNGTFETQIGSSDTLPSTSRNGNLQITQFYYGAAQPSNAAALIAGSLFYGSAQDNGGPRSVAGIINNGNIVWNGPGGDAAGVATDQQGNGTTLPVLLALLRRRRYQLLPGQRRRPDLRPAPGQRRPSDPRPAVAVHRAAPTSPSTRSTARTSSSARPSAGSSPPPTRA